MKLTIARWSCLIGGVLLPIMGVVEMRQGNQSEGSEMTAMGVGLLLVGVVWTYFRRRRRGRTSEAMERLQALASAAEAGGGDGASAAEGAGGGNDPQDFIQAIPGLAQMHIEKCRKIFDKSLEYSPEAFQMIDEIIDEGWGGEAPAMLESTVIPFGAFVGEAFRNLHGGEWSYAEETGYALEQIGGHDIKIFPFSKVAKRFTEGEGDSIAFYYSTVKHLLEEKSAS